MRFASYYCILFKKLFFCFKLTNCNLSSMTKMSSWHCYPSVMWVRSWGPSTPHAWEQPKETNTPLSLNLSPEPPHHLSPVVAIKMSTEASDCCRWPRDCCRFLASSGISLTCQPLSCSIISDQGHYQFMLSELPSKQMQCLALPLYTRPGQEKPPAAQEAQSQSRGTLNWLLHGAQEPPVWCGSH